MPLPISRNTTYAADSVVRSADLNDIQDAIVNLHAGEFVTARKMRIHAMAGAGQTDGSGAIYWEIQSAHAVSKSASRAFWLPIALDEGDRITAARAFVRGTASNAVSAKLWKAAMEADGSSAAAILTPTQIGSTQTGAATLTHETLIFTGLTETIATNLFYYMEILSTAGLQYFYGAEITYDHP